MLSWLVGRNFLYEDEIVNQKKERRDTRKREEKCEEEGKLTEEFEAQAFVLLSSLYLRLYVLLCRHMKYKSLSLWLNECFR